MGQVAALSTAYEALTLNGRKENIQGVLAKSHYSCIDNSLTCHIKDFYMKG